MTNYYTTSFDLKDLSTSGDFETDSNIKHRLDCTLADSCAYLIPTFQALHNLLNEQNLDWDHLIIRSYRTYEKGGFGFDLAFRTNSGLPNGDFMKLTLNEWGNLSRTWFNDDNPPLVAGTQLAWED